MKVVILWNAEPEALDESSGDPWKSAQWGELVSALSPVSHKGLLEGCTQTSLCLQGTYFTSHHTSSHVFWAYLYSTGTQHGNVHPTVWRILFCEPTQEPVLATANTGKNRERFWNKCRWMERKGRNERGRNPYPNWWRPKENPGRRPGWISLGRKDKRAGAICMNNK